MRTNAWMTVVVMVVSATAVRADLLQAFDGFELIQQVGISGLESSYHLDTKMGLPITGPTTGTMLPAFGPNPVVYPSPVGPVPSPGGAIGKNFDQGFLGIRVEGDQIIVQIAAGMNPQTGYYYTGWKTWYSQGDVFIDVRDSAGLSHFALLTAWARDAAGQPINLNNGHFAAAQAFHTTGGTGGSSLEGHLVQLHADADVTLAGGRGAYYPAIAPAGLDLRTFASNGTSLGSANLTHASVTDYGQTWYIQTWALPLARLSGDATFDIALHAVVSCGNDQIGGNFQVPEPGTGLLVLGGVAVLAVRRRSA